MSIIRRIAPHAVLVLSVAALATACDQRDDRRASDVAAAPVPPVPPAARVAEVAERTEMPERPEAKEQPERQERSASSNTTFTEGADGSVSMKTRNGAMVMSLRHDSVVVAFSDSMRNAIQGEMRKSMKEDAAADSDENSALGQMIKGVVKSTVTGAMREVFEKSRGFPVSDIRDVSFDDGAIRFTYVHKPTWTFDHINSDDEPLLEQFHPADAARFVGAVRANMKR